MKYSNCCVARWHLRLSPHLLTTDDWKELNFIPQINYNPLSDEELDAKYNKALEESNLLSIYPLTVGVKNLFSQDFAGIGRTAKLTLMTVEAALGGFDEYDIRIMKINIGWYETAVASVIMWRHAIDSDIESFLRKKNLYEVPLKEWKNVLSGYLNDVRRYNGIGMGDYQKDAKAAAVVRKLVNMSGRDLEPADFEAEYLHTNPSYSVKFLPKRKQLSTKEWWSKLANKIKEVVGTIFPEIKNKCELRTLDDWWKSRRAWVPNGSSSARSRLKEYKKLDERLKRQDRPGKKAVAETYDDADIYGWLSVKPIAFARLSTKPEPGFKRRALYASDDGSTYLASYASADIEKALSAYDMVIKQSPEDIVKWMTVDKKSCKNPSATWISLDYSDFNKEHSKYALYLLNMELAKSWLKASKTSHQKDIMLQKAYVAIWVARSHLNSWHIENNQFVRDWSGLWSGHRDTARDNTILHTVYSELMKEIVEETTHHKVLWYYNGKCGDDEDALHHSWLSGVLYAGAHRVCGFRLNPIKQLVGKWEHEFLQRTCCRYRMPTKPLPAVIATLSSGNWYKPTTNHFGSAISAMTGVVEELIVRGCDRRVAMNVALKILKKIMRVPKADGGFTKLEMSEVFYNLIIKSGWKIREAILDNKHHLEVLEGPWDGLEIIANGIMKLREEAFEKMDILEEDLSREEMPRRATRNWIELQGQWTKYMNVDVYEKLLVKESYRSMFGALGQKTRNSLATEVLGTRTSKISIVRTPAAYNDMAKELMDEAAKGYEYTKPISEDALIAKLHMDRTLFNLIGKWEGVYKYGKAKHLKHYINMAVIKAKPIETRLSMSCFDKVLKTWLLNRRFE
jgi:hypothetical protein